MDKWVTDYIHNVRKSLSRIAAYQDENIELHLQAQKELLTLLFAFNHQNYSRYLTYHHIELQALKQKFFSAYEQLKTYGIRATLFNWEKIFDYSRRLSYRGYCKSRSKDP